MSNTKYKHGIKYGHNAQEIPGTPEYNAIERSKQQQKLVPIQRALYALEETVLKRRHSAELEALKNRVFANYSEPAIKARMKAMGYQGKW